MSLQNFYVISRDLNLCDPTCTMCYDEISGLKTGPIKIAGWAYKYNKNCLTNLQSECPFNALRIDPI